MAGPTEAKAVPTAHPLFRAVLVWAFEADERDALAISRGGSVDWRRLQSALNAAARNGWPVARQVAAQAEYKVRLYYEGAFADAAAGGHVPALRELRVAGARSYDNALAEAARHGQLAAMRELRSWGASATDIALVSAALGGEVAAMQQLREWGAPVSSELYRSTENSKLSPAVRAQLAEWQRE
jgi:hypothetical protein